MPKAYVVPLDVPWMVSPSVSGMKVEIEENGDTRVFFNVSVRQGVEPRGQVPDPSNPRVVVTFASGQWVSFCPASGDEGTIDFSIYDQAKLPLASVSPDKYLNALDVLWVRAQRCPNPGIFEIESSDWVERTGAIRYDCRHYVIGGRDARLEVLARGFSWRYV